MELKNLPNQEDIYDLDTDDLRSLIKNIQTQINQNQNQEQKLNKLNRLLELSQIELSERENVENFGNLINLMGGKNQQYQNNNQQQNFDNYYEILNQNNASVEENQQDQQNLEKQPNQLKNKTPVKNNINTFDNIKAWEEFQLEFSEDKENKNKEIFLNNDPSQQEIENYNKRYNLQYKKLTDKKQNQNQAQIQTNLKQQEQNINNQKLSPIKNISYISNKSNQTSQEKSDKKKNLKNKSKSPISQSQKYQNTISHQQNNQVKYNQYNVKKFNSLKYGKDGIIIKEIYKPGNYQDLFSEDDIIDQQNIEKQQQKQENSQINQNIFKASSEDETTSLSHSGNTNFSNQKRSKNKNKSFLPPIENNKKSLNVKHHSYDNNSKQSQEFQQLKHDINLQHRDSHSSQSQTTQISNLNIEVSGHHKELFDQRSSFDKSSIASKDQSVSSRYSGNTKSLAQLKKQQEKNKEKKELMSQFIKETLQRTRVEGPVSMGKGNIGKYIPKEKTEVEPHMKSRFVVMTDKQQSNLEKQKGSREQYKVESKLKQDLQKRKIEQQQKIEAQGYISLGKPKVSFKYIPKTKPKEPNNNNNNKKRPNSQQKQNGSQNTGQNSNIKNNQQNRRNSYINKKDQQSNNNVISKKNQDQNSKQQKLQQQVSNDKLTVEQQVNKNQQQLKQQEETHIYEPNNKNVEQQIKSDLIINNEPIQQESQHTLQKNEIKIQNKDISQQQEINQQNQEDEKENKQTKLQEQKNQNKEYDNTQQQDNQQESEKRQKIKQNLNKKLLQNNNSIIEEQDEKFEDSYQNYSIENPIKAKSQQIIENEQQDKESEKQIEQKDRDQIKIQDEDLDTNEFLNQENIEQNQQIKNKNDDSQNQNKFSLIDSENSQTQNEFLDDQQKDTIEKIQQSENNKQQQEILQHEEEQDKDSDKDIKQKKKLSQAEYIQNLINTINQEKLEEKLQFEQNHKSKNDELQKNEMKIQKDQKKDENLNKNINYSPKSEKEQKILQNMLNQIHDPTIKEIMEKKLRSISQQQYQKQLQQEQENNQNIKNTQNKQEQNQSNEINTQQQNQTRENSEKQGIQNQQQQQVNNNKNFSRPPSNYQNKNNKQLPPTQKNPAPKGKQNTQQKQQVSQQKKQIQKMEKILASQPLKQDYTQYFTDFRQIFSYFYNKNISKNGTSGSHQFTSALLQNNNNNQNLQKQNGRQQIYISDKCFLNNQNQNQQLVSEFADNLMELTALFKYYAEKSQEKNFYTPESQILLTPFDLQKSESYYVNDPNQVRIYANRVEIDIKRFIDRQQKAESSDIPKKVFRVVKTKSDTYDIITRGFMRKDNWLQLPTGKGLRFTWNLLWTFSRPEIEMEKLLIFQKLNHFPGNRNLHRKDLIFQNIQRAQKISPQANKYFADIMPLTFLLPKEYLQFSERFQRDKNIEGDYNIWIMKPLARSQGKGINLINDISNVVYAEQMIVQKYLKKPLLIDNFKFDLRIYALVTSYNPLECFIFKEGFARISTEEFSLHPDDITNNQIHLTNYSIQKHFYDHTSMKNYIGGTKISLKMLKQRFLQQWDKIWNQIKEIIVKLLVCVQPEIPYNPNCFELYGFDVIIDSNFNCQILEVNTSPSLNRDFILDDLIKQQLIDDSLDLVNPIGFDHKRLAEVLERRLKDEQDKNTNYQDKDLLNKDLNYILKGQKIRQYGELPEKMGDFEMIAPGPILDQALKMTQKINKLSQK
ncbi:hypothetical protein PPERSA_06557 [Pseudocohnilembus persalinus]|uniref:Tubulin-tyrosine ligase family protein n=1 Tax=Pseudocohnilembus persalinus TaxID=266149 RepID=A0A0V0QRM7_PSEPJ|nr:hypothetical protein PPERSA_06557 [Pseudocohnilembus persalinus]|eukprot:KRX04923.1 hypothetical protein PPERSA_06557 [Pseudocohnilembus persalinus]